MTHRERVLAALRHEEPDLVPFYLAVLSQGAYLNLCRHLGLEPLPPTPGGSTAPYDERILAALGVDYRHLIVDEPRVSMDGGDLYRDEWGIIWRATGYEVGPVGFPLADASTTRDLARYPWPDPTRPSRAAGLKERARWLCHQTDFAVALRPPLFGGVLELGCFLRGTEKFLADLLINREFAAELIRILTGLLQGIYEALLREVDGAVHVVEHASDYGHQEGSLISPDLYRELFKPADAAVIGTIRKCAPGARVCFHSCGAIAPLIPDFIETGVDILNALQPLAKGIDLAAIKRDYGKRLVLHGAVDVQRALAGTIAEVREEINERLEILGPGGGYILAPSNIIQADVPPENILAMSQARRELGTYPLG